MIPERIAQIEATLRNSPNIPDATREELLDLLSRLKTEVAPLVKSHGESVDQIAGSADAAVQAAIRRDEQPEEATQAVAGLAASVRDNPLLKNMSRSGVPERALIENDGHR